ncbi:hypothetical protein U1Q18_015944 [Sarracenia purpurea var. burkii]
MERIQGRSSSSSNSSRYGACAFGLNGEDSGKAKVEHVREKAENLKEGSESWAEWVKEKLSEGLRVKTDEAKETYAKQASPHHEASDAAKQTKDKVQDVASSGAAKDVAEERKGEGEEAEQLGLGKEKAKEEYEAAKSKAGETVESVKEKIASNLEAENKKSKEIKYNLDGVGRDEEL